MLIINLKNQTIPFNQLLRKILIYKIFLKLKYVHRLIMTPKNLIHVRLIPFSNNAYIK